jgi:acyl dehydratase
MLPSGDLPTLSLHFERSPSLMRAYTRALGNKPTRLADGQTIPHMEATLTPRRVDAAHLAAFRAVCAQPPADTLPLTYPHVLAAPLHAQLLCAPSFPLRAAGLVHTSNLITAQRPLRPDEPLALHVMVRGHRMIHQHTAFDLVTTATASGEPVWEEITTIVSRGASAGDKGHKATLDAPVPGLERTPLGSAPWQLAADLGRRYAAVSGDYNPIHLHDLGARLLGQRRAIIHGMWTAARVAAALQDLTDAPISSLRIDFKRPIPLPSCVIFSVWRSAEPDAPLTFDVRSADGLKILALGEAT